MQKEKKIMLGIDPGIADTGYGVISDTNGKFSCIAYGSIKTAAKLPLADRLEFLFIELNEIIKKYKPGTIAVEQLFFCKNVKTALVVGHARGVILLAAKQNKLPVSEYTPLQIKQAVAAYGQAGKAQVQRMVKILLAMDEIPKPDDAADALAVAICGANSQIVNRKS